MKCTFENTSSLDKSTLPIEQLARIAIKEGMRPRAEYQTHKWFARRMAVTARGLLAAFGTRNEGDYWKTFYEGKGFKDIRVLDPFCGGGVMLLEAQRLGAHSIGFDVEPVAAAISLFQATLNTLPDLSGQLEELEKKIRVELAPYYRTKSDTGRIETLLHAFWVQNVKCNTCGHDFDAHPRFRLARTDNIKRQWVACSSCSRLVEADHNACHITCSCGTRTDPNGSHQHHGAAVCPKCNHSEPLIKIAKREGRPKFRLFAVESLPDGDNQIVPMSGRTLRTATRYDIDIFAKAKAAFDLKFASSPELLPESQIPVSGRSDDRLLSYGYSDYRELFNARQKLHVATLGNAIDHLNPEFQSAFAIAFSDHLKTNNMMCAYAGDWRRLTPLFSIRAYRHISRPVEINPWLKKNGRGTFPNAVRSVQRAGAAFKEHRISSSGLYDQPLKYHSGRCEVACNDSRSMPGVRNESIDLVLTDPPYLDYVAYSELGHFFMPWMHRFGLINGNDPRQFPVGQLAAIDKSRNEKDRFTRHLTQVFNELWKKLKPDGRFVFTYQNLDGRGWNAMSLALAHSGLRPISAFPLYGENGSRLHKRKNSISWDCVMVCKKSKPVCNYRITETDRIAGKKLASHWKNRLKSAQLPFGDGDIKNIEWAGQVLSAFQNPAKRKSGADMNDNFNSHGSSV